MDLFEAARKGNIAVTRALIQAFGRSAKTTLSDAATTSAALKAKLDTFRASDKWAQNFTRRQSLASKALHGEAGSVDPELVKKESMDEIKYVTKVLAGQTVGEKESEDIEEDDSDDGSPRGGGVESPPYAELSQHFGALENYASGRGLEQASYFLKRARMVMIEGHASKPSRQADVRAFL